MTPRLTTAIEEVYTAFADVPKPSKIEGCPHCIEDKGIETLLSKPLRLLSSEDLSEYAADVFLTVGDNADFFYFLPRILELLATQTHWWPHPEVVARAIKTSEFDSWPHSQQKSVLNYFDAILDELLGKENSGFEIDSWICAVGRLFPDISSYLNRIAEHPKRLLEFYDVNKEELAENDLTNSFWDVPNIQNQVVNWFNSPVIRNKIEATS